MIGTLVVRFKDIDYFGTIQNALNTIYEANHYSGGLPYTKSQICFILNKILYAHYLLFQNQFEYEPMPPEEFFILSESDVFINDETIPVLESARAMEKSPNEYHILSLEHKAVYCL